MSEENALAEMDPPVVDEVDSQESVETETPEVSEEEVQAEPEAEGAEEEETAEPEKAEKEEQVDEVPEPDSEIKKELEKLNKRLGYEKRQREKLEKQLREQVTPISQAEDTAAPKEADFESYEDFQQAQIDYRVEKGIRDYQTKVASTHQKSNLQSFIEDITERGRDAYSDYDAIARAETLPITMPMLQIMQECENPESIAYWLGKNVKDTTAISRMSPTQAARALGKIEALVANELKSKPEAPIVKDKKIVSNAPSPIRPTGSGHVVTKNPEKMTQSEYEAWRAGGGGT